MYDLFTQTFALLSRLCLLCWRRRRRRRRRIVNWPCCCCWDNRYQHVPRLRSQLERFMALFEALRSESESCGHLRKYLPLPFPFSFGIWQRRSAHSLHELAVVKDPSLDGQPNPHYVVPNEDLVTTRFFCLFPNSVWRHTILAWRLYRLSCLLLNPLPPLQIPYGLDLNDQLGRWLDQNYSAYSHQKW